MTAGDEAARLRTLEEEFDSEIRFRKLPATMETLVAILLFTLSTFHYWTAGFGLLQEVLHRDVHL